MSKRKKPLQIDDLIITGVTTRRSKVVRVQIGVRTIIDIEHCTTYTLYNTGSKAVHSIDEQTIKETARAARKWLKPPPGSIPIHGHNKPRRHDPFDRVDYSNDWGATEMY